MTASVSIDLTPPVAELPEHLPLSECTKAIVDGLVLALAGRPPREFRPALFEFRHSMCRSLRAMGLSEWDAYQHAREIERQADDELCLIWDDAWAEPGVPEQAMEGSR